ncbi:PadR family transcriptional regulator [Halospeciosus flavus]|uniref:PadR family transcriptional regulator n=1 Tax=Halospeciosus flavus TaxID=3032283 RepID=A0ABD5Z2P2_9EURY|nr:helix-turn-helix transcriptional regulator [Halospeciosus flavus]
MVGSQGEMGGSISESGIDIDRHDESSGDDAVARLLREIEGASAGPVERMDFERIRRETLEPILAREGDQFRFDDGLVKESLDELLVSLVALRAEGTHGKALIEALDSVFDVDLSPGTVYPRLHRLDERGILDVHEMVRTKEYTVADEGAVRNLATDAMYQHCAMALFFCTALEQFE